MPPPTPHRRKADQEILFKGVTVALIGLVYYTHGFAASLVYLAASAFGVALLWRRAASARAGA